jgi:hypothetical protein
MVRGPRLEPAAHAATPGADLRGAARGAKSWRPMVNFAYDAGGRVGKIAGRERMRHRSSSS